MRTITSFIAVALLLQIFVCSVAKGQIITTIAGNGSNGYSGDDIAATMAEMSAPSVLRGDVFGNIYIVDAANNRIRKVDTAGIITTVAGSGLPGFTGDNGPATNANLNVPAGVAIDAAGNLYIADQGNNCIRKVNAAGTITTFAGTTVPGFGGDGGPATAAKLKAPYGVAVDGAGNVYIADTHNNCIRMVDVSGNISTVAGNRILGYAGDGGAATQAQLLTPIGVTVDGAGNLYIADNGNERVRKVNAAHMISTVAGGGGIFPGEGFPATMAQLSDVRDVAVDASGKVYFTESSTDIAMTVDAAGNLFIVAGTNDTPGYSGDGGLATAARLSGPAGIFINASSDLFIADANNNVVRKVCAHCSGLSLAPASAVKPVIHIWPEPGSGIFTLRIEVPTNDETEVIITNVLGQKIKETRVLPNKDQTINLDAPPGVYLLTTIANGNSQSTKLTIR